MSAARGGGVLVTGFGPFLAVTDNPSARLALAVHAPEGEPAVHALVLPVSYARAAALTVEAARRLGVDLVLGLGVATGRTEACVERVGRIELDPRVADVDEVRRDRVLDRTGAPASVHATLPVEVLARALGAQVSEDAGRYVCNAWLYEVGLLLGGELPVGFVHLPPQGMAPERLRTGIAALLAREAVLG